MRLTKNVIKTPEAGSDECFCNAWTPCKASHENHSAPLLTPFQLLVRKHRAITYCEWKRTAGRKQGRRQPWHRVCTANVAAGLARSDGSVRPMEHFSGILGCRLGPSLASASLGMASWSCLSPCNQQVRAHLPMQTLNGIAGHMPLTRRDTAVRMATVWHVIRRPVGDRRALLPSRCRCQACVRG